MDKELEAVSRVTLETIPGRALTFLRAVGTSEAIRSSLMARGYAAEDHREGWSLLHRCSGFTNDEAAPPIEDTRVGDAIAELDAWDEIGFRMIRASLGRRFPAQATFVLTGLAPAVGAGAVLSVDGLLKRLDALESSEDRKRTRKEDQDALELLAKRGIDTAMRARLRSLVKTAKSMLPVPERDVIAEEKADDERRKALADLYSWYREWSEIARITLRRRDHLIRLGLASRRTTKEEEPLEPPPTAEPAPTAAEPTPTE